MKRHVLFVVATILLLVGCSSNNEKTITAKEYGDKWSFTADTAVIKCYKDGDIKAPVVIINGKPYGLTGYADAKYGQNDVSALNEYLLKDNRPGREGMMIDIGTITSDANNLCE